MSQNADVLIVGGGVVGLACAYYLSKAGRSVTLIEQNLVGSGSSHGNCGLISPSMALPEATPGTIQDALKSLFDREAPLAFSLRFDPAFFRWGLQFAKRCNMRDMKASMVGRAALLNSSNAQHQFLKQNELFDCNLQTAGLYSLYKSDEALLQEAEHNALLQGTGLEITTLSAAQVQALDPALREDIIGAHHYKDDGHLRPDEFVRELLRVNRQLGVQIIEQCELLSTEFVGQSLRSVNTTKGEFVTRDLLVCTGAWSPKLQNQLHIKLPIQPGKGYSITFGRGSADPLFPYYFKERRVVATPWRNGIRLGGTMEFAGFDASLNQRRLDALLKGAAEYIKPAHLPQGEGQRWSGWRPMTVDGLPLIGRSPAHKNVWLAAGHNMLGVSMAPGTGKLVAELMTNAAPHIDPAPYSPARFN